MSYKKSPKDTSVLVDFVSANLYCHETVPDPLQFSSNRFFIQSINGINLAPLGPPPLRVRRGTERELA